MKVYHVRVPDTTPCALNPAPLQAGNGPARVPRRDVKRLMKNRPPQLPRQPRSGKDDPRKGGRRGH